MKTVLGIVPNNNLRMPSMYSFRFRAEFEGEAGLLAMFNLNTKILYENIIPSLDITPVKSFFSHLSTFLYFFGT